MKGTDLIHIWEYDEWATNKLLDAAGKLDGAAFDKDLGASFRSLHGTFAHILAAQRLWLARWQGSAPTGLMSAEETPTVADLRNGWQTLYSELKAFISPLTDQQLHSPFDYRDMRGNPWSEPLYQQIEHLAFHSMYHRGQITILLRQLGQTPPQTDLIVYYRSANKNVAR